MPKIKITCLVCLILLITLVSFFPCLKAGFVNWDDVQINVVRNYAIREFSFSNAARMFSLERQALYQPLSWLSLSLDYFLFKLNPAGYHAVNFLLHLVNCVLVFWLILLISRNLGASFLTALLFAIHPLHVESVAWVSERRDLLYSFFFFLALISYCYYTRTGERKFYSLSLLYFLLSLLSKPMAIALVFLLWGLDYLFKRRLEKRVWTEKIPFILITALLVYVNLLCLTGQNYKAPKAVIDSERFFLFSQQVIFYLGKMFLPLKLAPIYTLSYTQGGSLPAGFILSGILFVVLTAIVIYTARYSRKIVFGYLFFMVMLLPTMHLGMVSDLFVADHYTYTSLVGIFYILSVGVVWLSRKRRYSARLLTIPAMFIIFSLLAFLTHKKTLVWENSFTLWDDVVKNYPSLSTAYNSRGDEYVEMGELDKAEADFRKAIQLDPHYLYAYLNLCALFLEKGEYVRAREFSERFVRLNPSDPGMYINLSAAYLGLGMTEEAEKVLKKAILNIPQSDSADSTAIAYHGLGTIYLRQGKIIEAMSQYERAILADPTFVKPYLAWAEVFARMGKHKEVINLCLLAIENAPESVLAYTNAGAAFNAIGDYHNSIRYSLQAVKLNPNSSQAYANLAAAYYHTKQYSLAVRYAKEAKRLGIHLDPAFEELLKIGTGSFFSEKEK